MTTIVIYIYIKDPQDTVWMIVNLLLGGGGVEEKGEKKERKKRRSELKPLILGCR